MRRTSFQPPSSRLPILLTIVLLHGLLIWAVQSGLFGQVVKKLPTEMFVTLIAPGVPASRPKPVIATVVPKHQNEIRQSIAPISESPDSVVARLEAPLEAKPAAEPVVPHTDIAAISTPALPEIISSGVEYLRAPQPIYPKAARRMREQGKALIRVLVDTDGKPQQAEIAQSSGSLQLDEAARQAVLGALFKPSFNNGQAVQVYALVPIRFQLDG